VVSILIVDDDAFLHKVLSRILTIGGHSVVGHAYDGVEAIEMFNGLKPKPDIILMDYRMPVMNGSCATKELKHQNPDCRILFISADDSIKNEALQAGASGFLTKPIHGKDLFEAIKSQMAQ
jgi:two-component system, chemotaxis family, chemotaxis protein CheY